MKTIQNKIDDVVNNLSDKAENVNYHEFTGMYQQLADILKSHVDHRIVLKIMEDVQDSNGFLP